MDEPPSRLKLSSNRLTSAVTWFPNIQRQNRETITQIWKKSNVEQIT